MKKISWKSIIGIIFIAFSTFALWLLSISTKNQIFLVLIAAVLIALGVFLIILDRKRPPTSSYKENLTSNPPPLTPIAPSTPIGNSKKAKISDGELNYDLFEDIEQDAVLYYEYETNLCLADGAIDTISGNGGKSITFKQEPENMYDNNAVGIYLDDKKIGYIYRGKIQDMYNNYINHGWLILGYINKYSVCDNKVTYKIGFYKPLEHFKNKSFSLVKTGSKIDDYTTRQDYLSRCDAGDCVDISYSRYDECYVVSDDNEIGELPKSASSFITEGKYKKLIGIIDNCEMNDNGKYEASVTVYIVE